MMLLMYLLCFASSRARRASECDINCFIESLKIRLDDFHISHNGSIFAYDISLHNITLYGLDLNYVNLSFYPNPAKIENGFDVCTQYKASADFDLRIHQTKPIPLKPAIVKVHAEIFGVNGRMGIQFNKDSYGLIVNATTPIDRCSATVEGLTLQATFEEKWEEDLYKLVEPFVESILKSQIGTILCVTFHDLVAEDVTYIFGNISTIMRPYLNGTSPISIPIGPGMSDVRTSNVIDVLRYVLTNLTQQDGQFNINSLVNRFTNGTGQISVFDALKFFNIPVDLELTGPIPIINSSFNVKFNDMNITGLNTWNNFDYLDPTGPYTLNSHTSAKNIGINTSFFLNLSLTKGDYIQEETFLTESLDFDLSMRDIFFKIVTQVAHKADYGMNFSDPDCINMQCLETLFSPDGTGITEMAFNTVFDYISFVLNNQGVEEEVREFFNNMIEFFIVQYKDLMQPFLTSLLNTYGTKLANDKITETLRTAKCVDQPNEQKEQVNYLITDTVSGGAAAFALIIFVIVCFFSQTLPKQNQSLESLEAYTNENEAKLSFCSNFFRTDSKSSLMMSPKLSKLTRAMIPICIFINTVIYISSNTGMASSVYIKFWLGHDKLVSLPAVHNFSLWSTIEQMWEAKTYLLAVLIFVMSIIWPYSEMLAMLFVWILPATAIKPRTREIVLMVQNVLHKWCFICTFIVILMLLAFNFNLNMPIMSSMITAPFSINLWVYPLYGYTSFIFGIIMTYILSHFMQYFQRKVDFNYEDADQKSVSLITRSGSKLVGCFVALTFVAAAGFTTVGLFRKFFSFELVGLTGWALKAMNYPYYKEYSVTSLAATMPEHAENPDAFVIRFSQAVYSLITIGAPLLHILLLGFMWFVPLPPKFQRVSLFLHEIVYAWSCIDVFAVSILSAVMQISQFAKFMVGDQCNWINPLISAFFSEEDLVQGHLTCFDVVTRLHPDSWCLFVGIFAHAFLSFFTLLYSKRLFNAKINTQSYISI